MLDLGPPRQLAYVVENPAASAADWAERFGAGPFFVSEHIPVQAARYRGTPTTFDHTSAYGWWGSMMIELVTQHGDEASAMTEVFAPGEGGVHHAAFLVEDYATAAAALERQGFPVLTECDITEDFTFGLFDTRPLMGHLVEIYERCFVEAFYGFVERASVDWDGRDPVRRL